MIKETMTADGRIDAAIRLEDVDRTPLIIGTSGPFVAKYKGMTVADAYRDADKIARAELELFDALGGWDARYGVVGLHDFNRLYPLNPTHWAIRRLMPGKELPDNVDVQNDEQEIMKEDEYDRLFEIGWPEFWLELVNRTQKNITWDMVNEAAMSMGKQYEKNRKPWTQMGIHDLCATGAMDPPVMLASWRSAAPFMLDIRRQYDNVKRAIQEELLPVFLETFRQAIRRTGHHRAMIPAARYLPPFVSPQVFEDIMWSWMKGAAEIALEEGAFPVFHLDSDWSEALHYFKELPKGKCLLHFGGETDIFKAKEILGGHCCIMGDISPATISVATPEEVDAYCRKLIDVIGEGNGFILCEGCFLPSTAKFENVKAMVDVAKNYKPR